MTNAWNMRSFTLPLRRPLATATNTISKRSGFAVRVQMETTSGVGEATPLSGWTESLSACRDKLTDITTNGRIKNIDEIDASYPATRHAIHLAQIDAAAQETDQSLAAMLSPNNPAATVPIYAMITGNTIADIIDAAQTARSEGYSAVKCKVGRHLLDHDIDRIRAIRSAVGSEISIRADANRGWTIPQARRALSAFAEMDVSYVEEPIQTPTPERLHAIQDPAVGIALDETVSMNDWRPGAWADQIDIVVLKPMAIGGIDLAKQRAIAARSHGLNVVISNTVDAVIARTAAVHLAGALHVDTPAGLGTASLLAEDIGEDPVAVDHGHLTVPTTPGLGTQGPWDNNTETGT